MIYAIGDIHGRFDLMERAIAAIRAHDRRGARRLVFLGDYVDRGPRSREVVERLIGLPEEEDATVLKGNHEDMMARALAPRNEAWLRRWLANGGGETLASYGVKETDDPFHEVPEAHLAWMRGLPLTMSDGHRIYVHAGLAPRIPLADQSAEACLWIREAFLRARAAELPAHVVHGHTPYWREKPEPSLPELLPHRTNLDTGAFATGILSIGVFDPAAPGGPVEVLTA
jgi:serine/threonine protein phosphatase 1